MRITREELVRRIYDSPRDNHSRIRLTPFAVLAEIAEAAACALGVEVVDGPGLPKRLSYATADGEAIVPTWLVGAVESESLWGGGIMRPLFALGVYRSVTKDEASAVFQEWLRCYNAKAEVLAIADELEHSRIEPDVHAKPVADRLRAAYGEPDTTTGVVSAVAQGLGAPTMKSGGQRVPGR